MFIRYKVSTVLISSMSKSIRTAPLESRLGIRLTFVTPCHRLALEDFLGHYSRNRTIGRHVAASIETQRGLLTLRN
jgi:hypothetical protein